MEVLSSLSGYTRLASKPDWGARAVVDINSRGHYRQQQAVVLSILSISVVQDACDVDGAVPAL